MANDPPNADEVEGRRSSDALVIAWGATLLTLIAVTWRLWCAPRVAPPLPPTALTPPLPWVAEAVLVGIVAYGVALAVRGRLRGAAIASVALGVLMALDQLRWQPWAYHALIVGAAMALVGPVRARWVLRPVTIAVYAFSAISKLDFEFASTLGQQMLEVLGGPVGIDLATWQPAQRYGLALSLPLSELALAMLLTASLVWRRLSVVACVAAVSMHAITIGVLGPWGLGHSLGVLLWNVGFAWQTVVLFSPRLTERPHANPRPVRSWLATALCGFAVVAPLATPLGWWDQWPGWALYAPGGERATLLVHTQAVDRLPVTLRPHVDARSDEAGPWRRVRLDDWVLEQTLAPIYPQNRVVASLADWLSTEFPLTDRLRLVWDSPADRWTGERTAVTLTDADAFRRAAAILRGR